jgi:ABC-type antimicrobial peptide transport system permease subunit
MADIDININENFLSSDSEEKRGKKKKKEKEKKLFLCLPECLGFYFLILKKRVIKLFSLYSFFFLFFKNRNNTLIECNYILQILTFCIMKKYLLI